VDKLQSLLGFPDGVTYFSAVVVCKMLGIAYAQAEISEELHPYLVVPGDKSKFSGLIFTELSSASKAKAHHVIAIMQE